MLRDAGYKTRMVGKWQLSERDFQAPHHFGFDEYLLWHFGMKVNGVPDTWRPRFGVTPPGFGCVRRRQIADGRERNIRA